MINFKLFINKSKDIVLLIIIGLLMLCAIFPKFDLTYTHGLDGSLSWIFNHIYDSGFKFGRNIIFAHGPLAFFMYPLQENLLFALFVTTLLQLFLIINIFYILKYLDTHEKWLITIMVSFVLLNLLSFNLLVLANIILLYLLYNDYNKAILKYLAFFLTIFAFYIKAHVAIISAIITFSFIIISLFKKRKISQIIYDLAILLGLFLAFWLLIYGSFSGVIKYCIGLYNMAMDNSEAASFYPQNNWICLSIFLLITFLISFVQKSPKGYYFGCLLSLSIFAVWKHGMSREDIHHAMEFLVYIILIFSIFLIYIRKNTKYNLILIFIAILLFGINLKNVVRYQAYNIEIISVNNLIEFIGDFAGLKDEANKIIAENLRFNKLPGEVLEKLGDSSVDVYPWDYSIIPANNLYWKPRTQLQSHTSFTPWLDRLNADHFNSDAVSKFLIWHLFTSSQSTITKTFESIDGRYLLNDEPQTIIQIMRNYELFYKDSSFIIYRKRNLPLNITSEDIGNTHTNWNTWITIPDSTDCLLKAKVDIKKNLPGNLMNFLYKGNFYYIYYKLSNGIVLKNRIVPKTACEGMWISPYISAPANNYFEPQVKEILFKCSNSNFVKKDIKITWQKISFSNEGKNLLKNYPYTFFGKNIPLNNNMLIQSNINFETNNYEWLNVNPENITPEAYMGNNGYILGAELLSPSYSLILDKFQNKELLISASCWIKSKPGADVLMVIELVNPSMKPVLSVTNINKQIINIKEWNNVLWLQKYKNEFKGTELKIYLVNIGKTSVLMDDFNIAIEQKNPENPGVFYN